MSARRTASPQAEELPDVPSSWGYSGPRRVFRHGFVLVFFPLKQAKSQLAGSSEYFLMAPLSFAGAGAVGTATGTGTGRSPRPPPRSRPRRPRQPLRDTGASPGVPLWKRTSPAYRLICLFIYSPRLRKISAGQLWKHPLSAWVGVRRRSHWSISGRKGVPSGEIRLF